MIQDKNIFITGGAGFIANVLIRRLIDTNRITVFDNFTRDTLSGSGLKDHPNLAVIKGDVLDAAKVDEALKGQDLVVHAAAIAGIDTVIRDPVRTWEVNLIGTANVLRAAARDEVKDRFLDFSTSEVFGSMAYNSSEGDLTVSGSAGEARWVYAVSKLAGEHLVKAYHQKHNLPTVTVRPFNVYGPGQTGEGAMQIFIKRALKNEDIYIYGDGTQIRAWCYVDDFVECLMRCLTSPKAIGQSYNIGNARAVITVLGLAQTVCRVLNSSSKIIFKDALSADIGLRIPSVKKIEEDLGFKAQVDLEEGIARTAEFFSDLMSLSDKLPLAKPWFGDEELTAVRRVLDSGWVVQGPEVAAFEEAVADLHAMAHGVAVSSATAGLHLIYLALGIGPGDVVLVPSFAWPSAANMAARVGATPFFVDVDPRTYNLTAATLEHGLAQSRRLGLPKPRAVVAVHEFGLAAAMAEINELAAREDLMVIEDAACALGARYADQPVGHFSQAAVFSFHPRKSITTGEGGVVVTREAAIAERIRTLRNHGQEARDGQREFTTAGFNYRLTEIQAAIGRVQLERLPEILSIRRRLATTYLTALEGTPGLALPAGIPEHTWQTFMVVLSSPEAREAVQAACRSAGIEAGPGSVAGHSAPVWDSRFREPENLCPVSTRLAECGLALPLHPRMTEADVQRVATTIRDALKQ